MKRAAFFFILLLCGCEKKEPHQESVFPIHVGKVVQKDVHYVLNAAGQLIPSQTVHIKPQVDGLLTGVFFEDGELVEEGALLYTLDPSTYQANFHGAEAQLEQDRARLKYALGLAESYGSLIGKEYISRISYEEGIQNVDVYKAAVEQDLASLKLAQIDLLHTEIRAPFKGYVGVKKCDCGSYVDPYQNEILVTLNKVSPLIVRFSIPSEHVQAVRECQKKEPLYLEAHLEKPGTKVLRDSSPVKEKTYLNGSPNSALKGQDCGLASVQNDTSPLIGHLTCIDNAVNEETGTILLRGSIPNLEEKGWPGQCVTVFLRVKSLENALLVPQNAIALDESGYFVFTADETTMTVHKKRIGKGINYQDYTVIEWGLQPNEHVVLDPQPELFSGAKITRIYH